MMRKEKFWQEGMDGKRFALCFLRKIWILPAAGSVCAAVAVLLYLLVTLGLSGPKQYEVFSQYRIYFDSEKYGLIEDYYNAYTWGQIMKTDQVLDFVMEELPGDMTKEQVQGMVSVGQMSDVKVMPLTVTSEDPKLAELVAQAYVPGLERFAESIEGLSGMECWLVEPAKEVPRATKTVNAGIFGFGLGMTAAFLILLIYYCLDDSVYSEEDLEGKYKWPVIGVRTKSGNSVFDAEYETNRKLLLGEKRIFTINCAGKKEGICISEQAVQMTAWPFSEETLRMMQDCDGVVLEIPWASHNGRLVCHINCQLEKHGVLILGAVITEADERYLKVFYGKKHF